MEPMEKLLHLIGKAKNYYMMADDALPAILEAEQLAIKILKDSGFYSKMSKSDSDSS